MKKWRKKQGRSQGERVEQFNALNAPDFSNLMFSFK